MDNRFMAEKPCIDCGVMIDADIWHEELGMCVDCSNKYFNHEEEE
jgi:NMD protein affecting ribosome stability and mRNA decay